ncbi:MAG TPA: hypothetical protein ENI73_02070 [Spirochaetes bacterium]|nr:hypothetical protein [Spirochaetota bacterium]
MIYTARVKIGDKVNYRPGHYNKNEYENGIVKEIPPDNLLAVRVVYNCAGDWENYFNYTSALTRCKDLYMDWRHY